MPPTLVGGSAAEIASAVEDYYSHDHTPALTVIPARQNRGKARLPNAVLDDITVREVQDMVSATMDATHAQNTKNGYKSYVRTMNDWYCLNHTEVCDMGQRCIDRIKFAERIRDPDILVREVNVFKAFIKTRKHHVDMIDGLPAPAKIGTLSGYRTAARWYLFTDANIGCPMQWDLEMKEFYKGLKHQEAARLVPYAMFGQTCYFLRPRVEDRKSAT